MKARNLIIPVLFTCLSIGGTTLLFNNKTSRIVRAATLPKTIDITDSTDDEIVNYYSSLSTLTDDQLTGTNLLKNLKSVINNNVTYFSYNQVTDAYLITDRDWANSPASAMSGYTGTSVQITYSTETSNNPYIHMLYHDYTNSSYSKTRYSGDGDVSSSTKSFDNEHAWSQSHGFATNSDNNITGAGSDMHHLIAGTQYGNRTLHNNYSYGFVKQNDGDWSSVAQERYNKRGTPLFPHSEDQQNRVFEPQDSDKGDIARALLYMVACYNNLDGSTPTKASPALELKNYVISENSTGFSFDNIANGYYGCLSDILAWHRLDPVDEFEIHRNNLIYKNYQHNRNPFIDYPQWVDYIWGVSEYDSSARTLDYDSTPTGSVDLEVDVINGYKDEVEAKSIRIAHLPEKLEYKVGEKLDTTGLQVMATLLDDSIVDVTNDPNCRISPKTFTKEGEQTVTVKYGGKSASFTVKVVAAEEKKEFPMKTVIIIGAVVVGVIVIILIFAGVLKVNKKGKVTVNKSKGKKTTKKSNSKNKK